jgi:hypothetical protein
MSDLTFTTVCESDDGEELKKKQGAWDFVGGRPSVLPGDIEVEHAAPEAEPGGVEIEIVRENPHRGRDVESDQAIEHLQAQYQEAKARAEAAEQTKAAYDAAIIAAGHRDEIAREYWQENERLKDAQNRFAQAARNFDDSAQAEIVTEIAQRTKYLHDLDEGHRRISEQATLPQARQQTVSDPLEAWLQGPGASLMDADKDYIRSRREFIQAHPDNADILQSAARLAEKRYGLQPGSAEYHEWLDGQIGLEPDDVQPPQPVRQTRKQGGASRRPVAAPGSRATGRSPQSRVHLSDFDMDQAKQLGMSFTDYAKIKSVANKREGQLTRQEAGGRLHARFSIEDHY